MSINNNIGLDRVQTENYYNFKLNFNDSSNDADDASSTIYDNNGHSCDYVEIDDFSEKILNIEKQISFFSLNIHSLPGKWNELQNMMNSLHTDKFKFTVISLTEIWNIPPAVNFNLPGYSPLHFSIRDTTGLNGNAGGGVGMWIDSKYSFEPIQKLSVFEPGVFESQFIKLKTSKNKFSIIGIYTVPIQLPKQIYRNVFKYLMEYYNQYNLTLN